MAALPGILPAKLTVLRPLGIGAFSRVYIAYDSQLQIEVAVKVADGPQAVAQLEKEQKTMRELDSCVYTPHLYDYGVSGSSSYLVMEKLGRTLLEIIREHKRLSVDTVAQVAERLMDAFEDFHSCSFIHKDVKPDNIVTAQNVLEQKLSLIDFGVSERFEKDGFHVQYHERESFKGSPYFASDNTLLGMRASRRDDMESVGYILVLGLIGGLPWVDIKAKTFQEVLSQIRKTRADIGLNQLCEGLPAQILVYLNYCKSLKFRDKPDYAYLKHLFSDIRSASLSPSPQPYDWVKTYYADLASSCPSQSSRKSSKRGSKIEGKKSFDISQAMKHLSVEYESPGQLISKLYQNRRSQNDLKLITSMPISDSNPEPQKPKEKHQRKSSAF